ncbi:MAG: aminopeptidase P family protein [Candidatus Hydrogenedentes bacterium]|nr:aminopeptidase P family protein [Candidatus Hydrogenedentota bacterium]
MNSRIEAVRKRLMETECDAFFSVAPPTNQYLTGFTGSTSAVVITANEALFLCDFRYTEQAASQVHGCRIEEIKGNLLKRLAERLKDLKVESAGFEPAYLTVDEFQTIQSEFSGSLKPQPELIAGLRSVKSPEEVEAVRAASGLAETVLVDLLPSIKSGISERELAARFEYEFKRRGASGASFDTIALFGARSSLPHGQPADTLLRPGDVVLLDFGCRKGGYCSDLTRTYVFGNIPGLWLEEIYAITLKAQEAALQSVKAGIPCRQLDAVARDIIGEAGYGKQFGHGLGHGVGIEIHEAPRLNPEAEAVLEAGMVITIEPGIYLPGKGGVRIEDLVVVTGNGCEVLTKSPKELKVLSE